MQVARMGEDRLKVASGQGDCDCMKRADGKQRRGGRVDWNSGWLIGGEVETRVSMGSETDRKQRKAQGVPS